MADQLARDAQKRQTRAGTERVLAIDIGGTWTRVAPWSCEHGEGHATVVRTPSHTNDPAAAPDGLLGRLLDMVADLVPRAHVGIVAVSLGAALDHRNGVVYGSGPLWGDRTARVEIVRLLNERRPDLDWVVVNDVTAMLHAYRFRHPELAGFPVMVATVSSGIAARRDDPQTGLVPTDPLGLQGEIGHLPATSSGLGLRCACGGTDHVASYASGPGIRAVAEALAGTSRLAARSSLLPALRSGRSFESALAHSLDSNDGFASQVVRTAASPLADVFTYLLTVDPTVRRVALAGGVIAGIGRHYRRALLTRMRGHGIYCTASAAPEWLASTVTLASHAETSPLAGAALVALRRAGWSPE